MKSRLVQIQDLHALAIAERAAQPHLDRLEEFMADDPTKTGLDRKLSALDEPHEVRSWTNSLGCTEAELRLAVRDVGNSAEKVREYLAGKGKP